MKFLLIDAKAKTAKVEDYKELSDAKTALGLDKVDHGVLARGLGYVVDEFGLFKPADEQHYFSIGLLLIAGNCVMYAYNRAGETEDIDEKGIVENIEFFNAAADVVAAIGTKVR